MTGNWDKRQANESGVSDNPWRVPSDGREGTARPGWLERTFGINTTTGRLGCLATGFLVLALPIAGVSYCSNVMEQRAAEEARIATEQKLAADRQAHERYQQSVTDGSVCADGVDGSNVALVSAVKANLRDPDSFQHVKTVIGRINDKFQYPTLMEYRARNGFGGYKVGLVHARLRVSGTAGCTIDSALSLTR